MFLKFELYLINFGLCLVCSTPIRKFTFQTWKERATGRNLFFLRPTFSISLKKMQVHAITSVSQSVLLMFKRLNNLAMTAVVCSSKHNSD